MFEEGGPSVGFSAPLKLDLKFVDVSADRVDNYFLNYMSATKDRSGACQSLD